MMKRIIGSSIERILVVGSTNNYAASQLLTKRPQEGAIFVADSQIDGRGQQSNKWESEPNKNLTFSLVLYPEFLKIVRQFELSKAISLGVADFIQEITGGVAIKWPNDLYIGRQKVAGMLIENSVRKDVISDCIVGIGLNVNQTLFSNAIPNPVSLSQITGRTFNLDETLYRLCLKLDARYQQLLDGDFFFFFKDYTDMLYQSSQWCCYEDENGSYEGQILGVDSIGRLRIESREGVIAKYSFKEVVFR